MACRNMSDYMTIEITENITTLITVFTTKDDVSSVGASPSSYLAKHFKGWEGFTEAKWES